MIYNIGAVSKSLREIVVDSGLLNDKNVNKHQSGGVYIQNNGAGKLYYAFNRPATLQDTYIAVGIGVYLSASEYGSVYLISDAGCTINWIRTDGNVSVNTFDTSIVASNSCCPQTNTLLTDILNAVQNIDFGAVTVEVDDIEELLQTMIDNNVSCCSETNNNLQSILSQLTTQGADISSILSTLNNQLTQLNSINTNLTIANTTISNIDGTLSNIDTNVQGVIVAVNNLDASLSTEIQDATNAINGQTLASSNNIITAINNDLDYVPTDTVVYWTAINAGVGYAIGDLVKEETTKKYEDNVLVSTVTVYTNMNTNNTIAPLITDLGAIGGTLTATNQDNVVKLYDLLPSGECVPYFAIVNSDGAGNYITHTPIIYTPTGSTLVDAIWSNVGYESISIDDTAVYTLTVPSGANHADINFIGTTNPLQPVVDYAWYQVNAFGPVPTPTNGYKSVLAGQEFDLQGLDELQAFKIIAGAGMSGTINVSYKFNPNMQI